IKSSVTGVMASIEIYNVLGEKVYFNQMKSVNSQFEIDISNEPAGMYFYRLMTRDGHVQGTGKLIIE
ncbi:MAG TPA: T9SS type A sorting domain-containing protein, partial [Bacteroidia bacterium]|nr:T9SS type A sorting domain-containing protein [Bacteroidia bacterium]